MPLLRQGIAPKSNRAISRAVQSLFDQIILELQVLVCGLKTNPGVAVRQDFCGNPIIRILKPGVFERAGRSLYRTARGETKRPRSICAYREPGWGTVGIGSPIHMNGLATPQR